VNNEQKLIVGSEEWCSFPALGIPAVKARVDSGARTSALHAFNIHPFNRGRDKWISFEVHPIQRNRKTTVRCEAAVVDRRIVKSSSGDREKRYVIASTVHIGGSSFDIELTLTNRDTMGYRMLLGREAMSGRMLVDPAASFSVGDLTPTQLAQMYGVASSPSSGLKIGLLASNPELYSNKRLIEAGINRGHDMVFLDIKQCYMKLDAETPEVHYRGGWILNDLDAVIPRIKPSMTFYGCALTRHFESIGVYPLNQSTAIN
jgi:ribosomal protein S6--L-glutamate ligase